MTYLFKELYVEATINSPKKDRSSRPQVSIDRRKNYSNAECQLNGTIVVIRTGAEDANAIEAVLGREAYQAITGGA